MDKDEIEEAVSKTHIVPLHKRYFAIISLGCALSVIPSMYVNSLIYWELFEYPMPLVFGGSVLYYDAFIHILRFMVILLGLLFGLIGLFIAIKKQLSQRLVWTCIFVNLFVAGIAGLLHLL